MRKPDLLGSVLLDLLVCSVPFYRILSPQMRVDLFKFHAHSDLTELFRTCSRFSSEREPESNFPQLRRSTPAPAPLAATFIRLGRESRARPT